MAQPLRCASGRGRAATGADRLGSAAGAAWTRKAKETGREYLSVKLDDPSFPEPIYASLVEAEAEGSYNLIWSR